MGGKLLLDLEQDDVCNIYSEWKSSGQFFIAGFEGIPQNLVLNIFCATGVIIGFSFARRLLWNYGRIAIIQRNVPKWKEQFSGEDDAKVRLQVDPQKYMFPDGKVPSATPDGGDGYDDHDIGDTGIFSWIRITLTLSEDRLCLKCGADAVLYLRYQRHLIVLSFLISLCSMLIILPIHIHGDQLKQRNAEPGSFARTTLANLSPESPAVVIHTIMAFVYFILSITVMRHFTRSFRPGSKADDEVSCRTVMILGIQQRMCHAEKILAHISEIYPSSVVKECTFAYNTSRLANLEFYKSAMIATLKNLQDLYQATSEVHLIRPYPRLVMGFPWWTCCGKQVEAIKYYSKEIRKYKKLADYERARTLGRPLGICLVTFRTAFTAERMIQDYGFGRRFVDLLVSMWGPFTLDRTPQSRYSRKMRAREWFLLRAPSVSDIQWENYALSLFPWYLKSIMVNFTVLLLALFFSTPIILIKTLNYYVTFRERKYLVKKKRHFSISAIFYELFPTFLIWVAAVTLPSLVSVSDRLIGFWTRTAENKSRMIKTFSFLVTMVVILPSLGLSSILYTVGGNRLKWECIYSPSNSAFFMNYVTTSCFLGTTSELWRFPELFYIVCKNLWKKSSFENPGIQEQTVWEFQIGSQYAWMMLVFSVFTVFSVICPLITPLGVIYMMMKHFVDKYNIYFAYGRCRVDNSVHKTAANFVLFCMFLLLTITFVFTNIAWSDQRFNPNLQTFATQLFVVAIFVLVWESYVDLKGTLGTILFRSKELAPWESDHDVRPPKQQKLTRKQKLRKYPAEYEDENWFYKTVPRIPILPQNRYFAPMLRKDFPFAIMDSIPIQPITPRLNELLVYAELSLQHLPLLDHLIHKISLMNLPRPQRPANQNQKPENEKKHLRFDPAIPLPNSSAKPRQSQSSHSKDKSLKKK